jgi:hypothetical protein
MRILPLILAAGLLTSLASCNAPKSHPNIPVATGTYIASYAMAAGEGARVRISGKSFHILQDQITWDGNGSQKLHLNWGLLELHESPNVIDISLDGVVLANVPK